MKKFKGVILAGGRGSRLSPITNINNKFLQPVYDKLMIEYSVETLVNAGVTDIAIVLGVKSAGETIDYLQSGKRYGCKFTYLYQDEPLGVPHALLQARSFAGNDPIVVMCADNLIFGSIAPYLKRFEEGALITTKVFYNPEELKRFAILGFEDEKLKRLIEKPEKFISNVAFCGIQIYDKEVWTMIPFLEKSARGEYEVVELLNWYCASGLLDHYRLEGEWFDCGTPEALVEAQAYAYKHKTGGNL